MKLSFDDGAIEWPGLSLAAGAELHDPEDRTAWLALRNQDVTASTAGALLGVHDYQTPLGLWSLKAGRTKEDPEETSPMRRGRLLEPVALQMLREDRPNWQVKGGRNYYWRDQNARIGATPDCYGFDENGTPIVVQFKTVEPMVFRNKWQGGDKFGVIEPPLWIVVQALIEAKLTGANRAFVAALVVGFGIDLYVVEIPLHDGVLRRVMDEVATFWESIATGTAPTPDFKKDSDLIVRLFPVKQGVVLDLRDDNMLPALVERDIEYAAAAKTANDLRDAVRSEIRYKLGIASTKGSLVGNGQTDDQTMALYTGGIITAKNIMRRSYTTKDTTYLDLRLKPGKEAGDEQTKRAVKPKRGVETTVATYDDPEVF